MNWISVDERLPSDEAPVLGTNGRTIGVYMRFFDADGWCWSQQKWCWNLADPDGCEFDDDYEITHWMPLPAPPSPSEQGKNP